MTAEEFHAMRDELGITVSDLARVFGIERRTIQRWQKGEARIPPYVELALERLAQLVEDEP